MWNQEFRFLILALPLALCVLSHFSRVRLCASPWTAAHQAPPSMGFSRQEYWSGVPLPSLGSLCGLPQTLSSHLKPGRWALVSAWCPLETQQGPPTMGAGGAGGRPQAP